MIDDLKFGKSSARIVIEEFLTGPEVSVLSASRTARPWCL